MKSDFDPESIYPPDFLEWIKLTPAERVWETGKLWQMYLDYGGSLEAEPDPQSPFYDPDSSGKSTTNGGAGLRIIRRC